MKAANTPRKLLLSNPKAVGIYLKEVEQKFDKQNIFFRTRKLLQRIKQGQTNNVMEQYEKIDR